MPTTKQTRRTARQLLRLCSPQGRLDEARAGQLLQRVLQEKPRGYLGLLTQFRRLLRLQAAQHTARVQTATTLAADQTAGIGARLEDAYGPGLELHFSQDPGLLGGMCITVGSDVYDGSVRARLAALEQSL